MYKVMWAAHGENIVWNMRQESLDTECVTLVHKLGKYINVEAWVKSYKEHYCKWLKEDAATIFTINAPLLASMLSAIRRFNQQENNELYYWFDIDRLAEPAFQWRYSPLSGEKLLQLPASFSLVNQYIAPTDFLVFPSDFLL